tara:strand:- start:353 stop:541 length:189 start_codon:yes stop_codon:yes gene_type:complete
MRRDGLSRRTSRPEALLVSLPLSHDFVKPSKDIDGHFEELDEMSLICPVICGMNPQEQHRPY